jgi:hypothetical protein
MPNTASPSTQASPKLLQPVNETVRESATAFEWSQVPDAASYHLQIAPSEAFDTLLFDSDVGGLTHLTVYDAVPQDGSTYHWRVGVRTDDGDTRWSDAASFAAEESVAASAAVRRAEEAARAPTPESPTGGAPVDGRSANFAWNGVPQALRYELQVAGSSDFDDPLTVEPGSTTVLTLYSLLPTDGSTFFWRVRALHPDKEWTRWSDPARFTAATDEEVISYEEEQERREAEATKAGALAKKRNEEVFSPVLVAETSPSLSLSIASTMVVSFLITLVLVARAVM